MEERKLLVALHHQPGIGETMLVNLWRQLGSIRAVWEAPVERLVSAGLAVKLARETEQYRQQVDPEALWSRLVRMDVAVLVLGEEGYPPLLQTIYSPPPVLYYRGCWPEEENLRIAVVGARRASDYGLQMAYSLAAELAQAGVWVVSGMARGIDTRAHYGALDSKGKTAAVLGCGLDVVYPPENKNLMQRIGQQGLVVSEFPLGTSPKPGNFPARNRIISGLAQGVVVVEAGTRSGALVTADFALEQGRDVFAVPGLVTHTGTRGTHGLIKQGAKLVECGIDVLEEYLPVDSLLPVAAGEGVPVLSPSESQIFRLVQTEPKEINGLATATGFSTAEINAALMFLELKGMIRHLPGGRYQATRLPQGRETSRKKPLDDRNV